MTTPVTSTVNVDDMVLRFIEIRDVLKALEDAYEAKRKPLLEVKERISGELMQFLDDNKLTNAQTKHGTVHTTTRSSASLTDAQLFFDFVLENERYELLDKRANATAVKDYVKENGGNLPPGVNLSSIKTVGVRRA